jgi:hypothetical protein
MNLLDHLDPVDPDVIQMMPVNRNCVATPLTQVRCFHGGNSIPSTWQADLWSVMVIKPAEHATFPNREPATLPFVILAGLGQGHAPSLHVTNPNRVATRLPLIPPQAIGVA